MSGSPREDADYPKNDADARLLEAYARMGVAADELPYSNTFDQLLREIGVEPNTKNYHNVFRRLLNLRKSGRSFQFAKFGPIKGLPVLSENEVSILSDLVIQYAGSIGRRDRLPYSRDFEKLKQDFETRTQRTFEPAELWKLILRRAKNP